MNFKIILLLVPFCFLIVLSCDDQLDKGHDDDFITDEDIFKEFERFQGFVDQMHSQLIDYNSHSQTKSLNIGGEVVTVTPDVSG